MTSKTELSFQCLRQWESMTPTDGGRFCDDCRKTVIDFSKIPVQQLDKLIQNDNTSELCGNFYAYQLKKPFGNWRDKVISFNQKYLLGHSSHRHFTILILTLILVMTGCARRLRGKVAKDSCNKNHKHNTRTLDSQPTTK